MKSKLPARSRTENSQTGLEKVLPLFALYSGILLLLIGCNTVDRNPLRIESACYGPAEKGVIAEECQAVTARFESGHSGFHLLERADDALNWRLALVDHATRSIDIQYYLWNADETGLLLISHLLEAADRGVRVRILLDDFWFKGQEERMAALCFHPNLEIRVFNPRFARNGGLQSTVEILRDFDKLNRRMHNKVLCVDDQIAVIGGRNIGNEYFGLSEKFNFIDLDVMAMGPVVSEVSKSFDSFWNSKLSYPGKAFSKSTGPDALEGVVAGIRSHIFEMEHFLTSASFPAHRKDWTRDFSELRPQWHSGAANYIAGTPNLSGKGDKLGFAKKAFSLLDEPCSGELLFVSPYLLPGKEVNNIIEDYVTKGAQVKMLTASLGANNHLIVHSHYRKHRRPLLARGVQLHEMKDEPSAAVRAFGDAQSFRSDKLALHVKAGVGDRTRCFIGSLNLDPRSAELNTENGLIIESPSLARELAAHLDMLMATESSWKVSRDKNRQLVWRSEGKQKRIQPAPGPRVRLVDFFLGMVPVEDLL